MSETVNVQGILVPLNVEKTDEYNYKSMPNLWNFDATEPRANHYTKDPAQAHRGELVDASMNSHGVVEAGYKRGDGMSDFDWFRSTGETPRA